MSGTETRTGTRNIKRLAGMLLELDDLLISCMRCGFCLSACPVYGATMLEGDVTRGKIALLENLAKHMISDAQSVNNKLNRCLLCGSCQAVCPSGVKIMDIFLRARAVVTGYLGLSPLKKLIFRGILTRPKLFNSLLGLSSALQGLFIKKTEGVETYCAPLLASFIGHRHFPPLAKKPFHSRVSSLNIPAEAGKPSVAFCPGCVSDNIFPAVAEASLKALKKHGIGVFMPAGLCCCGIPALASGDRPDYDRMLRNNLKRLRGASFQYLLTPCGTCTATIREFWPKLADDYSPAEKEQIRELHEKCMDISAFVVDVLKVELPAASAGGPVVTYHDSCHLKKSLGVAAQPRSILKSLPGFSFAEMPEADRCCGSGGSFTLQHYDLSMNIGQRKRDNIVSVKADIVAAGCPACMMQMMDALSRNGDKVRVRHVMELYADTL
jgi:glycolate oxidase iron-sulfur subunit